MAEWSIAVVLKTTGCVPEGSNPSTPWLRGGMVDTLHLGCKRCGFESRRGHHYKQRQVAEWSNAGAC